MNLTDEQFKERKDALINDVYTKKMFVEDKMDFTNLFDFLTYEVYGGDSGKVCEKLAEYFSDDYLRYCERITVSWFEDDDEDDDDDL